MELKQVGEKTYYIENNTNIGIYLVDDKHVFLIDTGNDKEAGKKILKIVTEQGWEVVGIISTHSNADHVGGNKVIQERTNCKIYSYGIENGQITIFTRKSLEAYLIISALLLLTDTIGRWNGS